MSIWKSPNLSPRRAEGSPLTGPEDSTPRALLRTVAAMASLYLHSHPIWGGRGPGRLSPVRIRRMAQCRHPMRQDVTEGDEIAEATIPEQRTDSPIPEGGPSSSRG